MINSKIHNSKIKLVAIFLIFCMLLNIFSVIIFAESNEKNEIEDNIIEEENIINEENIELDDNVENIEKIDEIDKVENLEEVENIVEEDKENNEKNNEETILEDIQDQVQNFKNVTLQKSTTTANVGITYQTHIQNVGWQDWKKNGETSGTSGKSLRLEGIKINLVNFSTDVKIKYQTHIQNIGWQDWKENEEFSGTEGQSLRLEAIRIKLETSEDYSIIYRTHIQNVGWQDWKYDGELSGTEGQSLRLEAIEIKIVPKKIKSKIQLESGLDKTYGLNDNIINIKGYKLANISDTRIEAYVNNTKVDQNNITYLKREDIVNKIVEYGTNEQNENPGFNIKINATNLKSGTYLLIIKLLTKDSNVINTFTSNFVIDKEVHIEYSSHIQNIGWQKYVRDGEMSGTSGKALRIEAICLKLTNVASNAKILYRTHIQNIGWQDWKTNNDLSGTEGKSLRIEAIEIKLQNMDKYTVEYQVHIQNVGWSEWYIDGETAGTIGQAKRIEAIRIRLVPHYKKQYKGIDVSQFNGSVNWNFVKSAGIDFAFIRVGIRGYGQAGNFREDNLFKANILAANQAGVSVGVYFVTQAITEAEAIEEANWVLERVRNYKITYPIAIDIESAGLESPTDIPRTQNLDKETRTAIAKKFCETIKNAGYTPIIYTNVNWANNYLTMSKLADFDTWIAHYTYDPNKKTSYTGEYTIWQYTDIGRVNGVIANVDMSISYKKY